MITFKRAVIFFFAAVIIQACATVKSETDSSLGGKVLGCGIYAYSKTEDILGSIQYLHLLQFTKYRQQYWYRKQILSQKITTI